MKKFAIFLTALTLNAYNIHTLFDKIKEMPESKIDNLQIKKSKVLKKNIISSLYPQIDIFASAEHYNVPFSIRPLTPTESGVLIKTNAPIPFSKNILRIGFNVYVPLYIKSIYDNKEKMTHLINATKYQAKLNLLQRQSLLVISLSNLNYLYALKQALISQKNSINTTINAIKVGVELGRVPEFKLIRLKDAINQIKININNIDTNINKTKSQIYKLTKIKLKNPINFSAREVKDGEFFSLKPLKENLKASKIDIKAKKDNFYPKIFLKVTGNRGFGWAYNNDESVALNTFIAGIYVNWSIFNKKNSSEIEKSKIEYLKNSLTIQKTIKDLKAQIDEINQNLKIINKSINYQKKSISLKKELLHSAKVAFKLNTMTVDEYLTYEDELTKSKATLANLIATKNSLIAQKAMIFGKNFKKVFK